MLTEEHLAGVFCVYTRGVLYRSSYTGKSPLRLTCILSAALLWSCTGRVPEEGGLLGGCGILAVPGGHFASPDTRAAAQPAQHPSLQTRHAAGEAIICVGAA